MVGLYYSASILAGRASAPFVLPPCIVSVLLCRIWCYRVDISADNLNRDTPTVFMEAVSDFFTAVFTSCPYYDRNFPSPNFFVWKMWISVVVGAGGLLGHALAAPDIHAKRSVLSDLSNGFYHSWKFGSLWIVSAFLVFTGKSNISKVSLQTTSCISMD